jgi:hypothetical protein
VVDLNLELNRAIWNTEYNCFLSEEHRRIAEIIKDYDSNLELAFIPPGSRSDNDTEPFAILHTNPDTGYKYVARTLKEDEVDHRVLAWLWDNDTTRVDVLSRLEAEEAAKQAVELKKRLEQREEAIDFGTHVLNGKNWYKHNGITYS